MGYCSLDVGIIVSSNGTARMDHDREQLIHIGTLEIGGGKREEEGEGVCTHTDKCTPNLVSHNTHKYAMPLIS